MGQDWDPMVLRSLPGPPGSGPCFCLWPSPPHLQGRASDRVWPISPVQPQLLSGSSLTRIRPIRISPRIYDKPKGRERLFISWSCWEPSQPQRSRAGKEAATKEGERQEMERD